MFLKNGSISLSYLYLFIGLSYPLNPTTDNFYLQCITDAY